jgi:hypothetical protein
MQGAFKTEILDPFRARLERPEMLSRAGLRIVFRLSPIVVLWAEWWRHRRAISTSGIPVHVENRVPEVARGKQRLNRHWANVIAKLGASRGVHVHMAKSVT